MKRWKLEREKPARLGEYFDLQALLANIETELKVPAQPPSRPRRTPSPQSTRDTPL